MLFIFCIFKIILLFFKKKIKDTFPQWTLYTERGRLLTG